MELTCTRPGCPRPANLFPSLSNRSTVKSVQQKFCTSCGMPLILAGRYLPQRLLGKGGFGAAYYAVDRFSPALRPCVVKLFQPDGDLSPQQLELAQGLFEREAEALEDLGNANSQIPDLLAFFPLEVESMQPGKQQELFYLVQEYIDGQSLEQELAQRGAFSESEALEILEKVLPILEFVHSNNSIHRDIKPSNVMRDRNGKIYLLDFGAVKQVTQSAAGAAPKASTGIYSMGYAPTEQMQGSRVYPATDLYALGVTVLVLLTNQEPEELFDSFAGRWNFKRQPPISKGLELVLTRMLEAKPSDRFDSARTTLKAIALVKGQSGLPASPAASGPSSPSANSSGSSRTQPPPLPNLPTTGTQVQNLSQSQPPSQPQSQPSIAQPPANQGKPFKPAPSPAAAVPVVQPSPGPIQSAAQNQSGQVTPAKPASPSASPPPAPVSLTKLLGGALFAGMEGSLLAIALLSLLGTALIGPVAWVVMFGALLALQYFRVVEGVDLLIILGLTLLAVALVPALQTLVGGQLASIAIIALASGLFTLATALLFQLLYRLLKKFL